MTTTITPSAPAVARSVFRPYGTTISCGTGKATLETGTAGTQTVLRNLSISSRQHATADDAAWALNNAHLRALEISVGSLPAGRALAMLLSASPDLTPAAAETAAVLLCDAFGVATTAPAVTVLSQISYGLGGMGAGVVTSAILTAWALETR